MADFKGKLSGAQIDELPNLINEKQALLSAQLSDENVYNIGPIVGEDIRLSAATPSGDPMHYIYELEGAKYNASESSISQTAPWGDSVRHHSKCWYLNGLGDITTAQMRKIYALGHLETFNKTLQYGGTSALASTYAASVRTNLPRVGGYNGTGATESGALYSNTCIEVFNGGLSAQATGGTLTMNGSYLFYGCKKLRAVVGCTNIKITNIDQTTFADCLVLERINIAGLSSSVDLSATPQLSKDSLLYMINNSAATSAITIKLNAKIFRAFAYDSEVSAALAQKSNITLISE